MPELDASSPLAGLDRKIGTLRLREIPDRSLASVLFHHAAGETLATRLGITLPPPGGSARHDGLSFARLQTERLFCVAPEGTEDLRARLVRRLGDVGGTHVIDECHGFATLRLDGRDTVGALERLCMLDLDIETWPVDGCRRTSMAGLGIIMLRTGERSFELHAPRSSAASFAEALARVVRNIDAEARLSDPP